MLIQGAHLLEILFVLLRAFCTLINSLFSGVFHSPVDMVKVAETSPRVLFW